MKDMVQDVDAAEVHVLADGSGLIADSIRLSDETVRRSELLQNIRDSCVGSTIIPVQRWRFKLWCNFEPDGSSWADLVNVMETSRFLQDSASHAEACREFASDIRRAVRAGYSGHVADRISDIPAPGNASLLSAAVFDKDLISHLLAMGDHSLSSVLKQVSMHDIALLPNAIRMRSAALTARLADGALSLSGAMAVGADDMREGYPCQSMFREYAPFIEQLQLRRLDLARNGLACDDGIALLHVLSNQPELQHLDLSGNTDPTPDSIIPALSVASALTFLSLSKCMEYNAREPVLRPISHLSHLAHLDILGCQMSASELKELDDIFTNFTALTHLQMGSFQELEVGAAASLTHHLPLCMCHLTLSWGQNVSLAQTNYATLPDGLRRLTTLTFLCLGDPDPYSDGFKYGRWPPEHATLNSVFSALATLPHLSHFSAPMLRAPPRILAHLAGATRLRHLALAPNLDANFSDLTQLTSLHIRDDPSGTPGSRWCHLKPLTGLRRLHIHKFITSLPAVQGLYAGLAPASATLQDLEIDAFSEDPVAPLSTLAPQAACTVPLFTQLTQLTRLVVKDWDAFGTGPQHLARALTSLHALCHLHVTNLGEHPSEPPATPAFTPMPVWAPWGGFGDATGAGTGHCSGAGGGEDGEAQHSALPPGADLGHALAPLTALTVLRLSGMCIDDVDEVVSALGTLRALRHLELSLCHLRAAAVGTLAALLSGRAFPLLEVLDVGNNDLSAAAVAALAGGLKAARRLRELRIPGLGGHEFERPRDNYLTEDDDDEDDTMASEDDGGSDASGGADVVLEAEVEAAVAGSEAASDVPDAIVVLSDGSAGGAESEASDGVADGASDESGPGMQGGTAGGAGGGVSGVAGMAAGVAGAAAGAVAEVGAALMMAMVVMASGGHAGAGDGMEDGSSVGSSAGGHVAGGSGDVAQLAAVSDEFASIDDDRCDDCAQEGEAQAAVGAGAGGASGASGSDGDCGGEAEESSGGGSSSGPARTSSGSGAVSGGGGSHADGSLPELLGSPAADAAVSVAAEAATAPQTVAADVPAAVAEAQAAAAELQAVGVQASASASDMHAAVTAIEAMVAETQAAMLAFAAQAPWQGMDAMENGAVPSVGGAGSAAGVPGTDGGGPVEQPPVDGGVGPAGAAQEEAEGVVAAGGGTGETGDGAEAAAVAEDNDTAEDDDLPWWQHEATAEALWQSLLRLPLDRGVDM